MLADKTKLLALEEGQWCCSDSWEGARTLLHWLCLSMCPLLFFSWGALTLCRSSVKRVALCEVDFRHFFPWVDALESWLAKLLSTLQVKATCAPPTSPSGGWTTQRTPTQTGLWSAGPARPAPCHLSPLQRVSTCAKAKTSSSPSWSRSSGVASNPARRWGYCSTRRRHTPLSRCSPTSQRPSSWTQVPWGGCTLWTGSRWVSSCCLVASLPGSDLTKLM